MNDEEGPASLGLLEEDPLLDPLRTAATSTEQLAALQELTELLNEEADVSTSRNEHIALYILQNVVAVDTATQEALLACLRACGPLPTLSAAVATLREASSAQSKKKVSSVVEVSLSVVQELLCRRPETLSDVWILRVAADPSNDDPVSALLDQLTNLLVRVIPMLVANVCQTRLPRWAIRSRYSPCLVDCAVSMALLSSTKQQRSNAEDDTSPVNTRTDNSSISIQYLAVLVHKLIQFGQAEEAALGLYRNYKRLVSSKDENDLLPSIFQRVHATRALTPRETALLVRAILQHSLSRKPSPSVSFDTLWSDPWLQVSCLPALQQSRDICDGAVLLIVLSPSSMIQDNAVMDRRLCHAFASLLAQVCTSTNGGQQDDDESSSSDSDEEDEDHPAVVDPCDRALRRQLNAVSSTWTQIVFVRNTDHKIQRHVTNFLWSGLTLLSNDPPEDPTSLLASNIMEGVTLRLGSSMEDIRKDGMRVATVFAKRLGQDIQFEELANENEAELRSSNEIAKEGSSAPPPSQRKQHVKKKTRRRQTHQLDPDAEYISASEGESVGDEGSSASSDFDDDSVLEQENLSPYDLEDAEEDLRETPRPLYLSDCLEMLRTAESEDHARSRHETALKELPRLVRSRPVDLADVSSSLAIELIKMENKFDLEDFEDKMLSSLISLTAEDPLGVGQTLVVQIFDEHGSLFNRLACLTSLSEAALELCGERQLEKLREERRQRPIALDGPRVSGKKGLLDSAESGSVALIKHDLSDSTDSAGLDHDAELGPKSPNEESRTRRWGRGRLDTRTTILSNRFIQIAPVWFYGLVGNFMECKENSTLWGGTVGATLLARLFSCLSMIVECCGAHPGSDVMAKDLFELVWLFREAEIPEVRASVFLAVATAVQLLRDEAMLQLLLDESASVQRTLRQVASTDSNSTCREIAQMLSAALDSSLGSSGRPRIMASD